MLKYFRLIRVNEIKGWAPRVALLVSLCSGCGPYYVNADDDGGAIVSTRSELLPKDVEALFEEVSTSLDESGFMRLARAFKAQGKPVTLVLLSIGHKSPPAISNALQRLTRELADQLKISGELKIIDRSTEADLLKRIQTLEERGIDKARVAALGKEFNAGYILTGRLYSLTRDEGEGDQAQHFLFMQVIDVKRGSTPWRVEVEVLKGLSSDTLERD